MVPHTHPGRCVALLGPFSPCETPPEECTDRTLGEIQWQAQPLKTPTVVYPQHMMKQIQCHTPAKAGQVQDETWDCAATHTPQPSIFRNVYEDETNTVPHTCFGRVYHNAKRAAPAALLALLLLSPSTKPDPNNAQTTPTMKYGSAQPPKTRTPSTICKIHDNASNMVPHTRFGGCVAISCTSTVQYLTRPMHRSGPGRNTAVHSHPDP
ncbi:hypothetical protein BS47DRAFT_1358571 [Hydnum rufescens UP504]|uniref:Uncharacterized protein n=1 Tax=Hydnum rufescens UP504 TaxID=1448309 RepID=A0A9P6B8K4_9AGAM|nr:hypothetical protein BS47DRAFT_1358571 [Hydnum rufescens UP504]